ncbi:putative disease resistance protein At4g11170 [Eucalyptus grandis]|uniref:putative disease resistance protein At4g11170 n=1 Tax=Eucalyptus grandis TaxID=71139 RepID=UPI00192F06B5|nr:putative disease resistance protein At4g11170 [Eucalyptus grandis]
MWDACEFFPEEGIEVLRFLSLIKVGDDHKLIMHDQLRDLGREIVRKENNSEPWNRSRLWDSEVVLEVLEGNKGTSKIEAIRLGLYDGSGSCTTETFKELTNLRFLQLDDVNLIGDFQNLLPRLRWLAWDGYHLHFELTNFHMKKLVVLNLSGRVRFRMIGQDLVL